MTDFDDRFALLRARFAVRAKEEALELERLAIAGSWGSVRDLAHGLAGRAGMFGHGDIGDIAAEVEEEIDQGREPRDRVAALSARLRDLDQGR